MRAPKTPHSLFDSKQRQFNFLPYPPSFPYYELLH
jgi:hypothetical protein